MSGTIYYNGQILTMDDSNPYVTAIFVKDGVIQKIGTDNEVLNYKNEKTRCINLEQNTLLPGFIDPHSHLSAMAYNLLLVNVKPSPTGHCNNINELITICKTALQINPPQDGQWLLAMGYDNSVYEGGKHPTKFDLDKISKTIPICITHASGHCAVLNSLGLTLLGYEGTDFEVPNGGVVERLPGTDEPSGLIEEAAYLSPEKSALIKGPCFEQVLEGVKRAAHLYASYGITTGQDARSKKRDYLLLTTAASKGYLPIDIVSYVDPTFADEILPKNSSVNELPYPYKDHYRIGGFKYFLDGSPQAKTAWLSEPYFKVPEGQKENYNGFPLQKEKDVLEVCQKCIGNGWQLNVHTNGDNAIEQFIRCYTKAMEESKKKEDLRPVSIHCQTVREDQLDRMKSIHMLPSFFLDHVYYWGDYHYESVLGPKRANRISPLHSAMNRNMTFTMHQDTPVVLPNVLFSIHNAVNRITKKGRVLGANQCIPVAEALKAATIYGAYQIFEESSKGSISEGKLADFVILDKNPLQVSKSQLKDIKVLETIKEDKSIYKAQ